MTLPVISIHGHAQGQRAWICAQKRPLTAFWQVMKDYDYDTFPDYLVIMDDDTWLNMERFVSYLARKYSPNVPYVIAGVVSLFTTTWEQ